MRRIASHAAAAAFAVLTTLGIIAMTDDQPECPTEDSCTVDFGEGGWTITEVTP